MGTTQRRRCVTAASPLRHSPLFFGHTQRRPLLSGLGISARQRNRDSLLVFLSIEVTTDYSENVSTQRSVKNEYSRNPTRCRRGGGGGGVWLSRGWGSPHTRCDRFGAGYSDDVSLRKFCSGHRIVMSHKLLLLWGKVETPLRTPAVYRPTELQTHAAHDCAATLASGQPSLAFREFLV